MLIDRTGHTWWSRGGERVHWSVCVLLCLVPTRELSRGKVHTLPVYQHFLAFS